MTRSPLLSVLLVLTLASSGCDEDLETCDLNAQPQLNPNAQAGVIGFELARLQESSTVDAVFINGGCAALQVDLATVRMEGPGAAEFELGQVFPENGRAISRSAIGIPITFTSPGRGVYLATLKFESNAENLPEYELDVVGPAANARIPDEADIEFFEDPVVVEPNGVFLDQIGQPLPVGVIRFYNLGARSLSISEWELADTTNFRLFPGTAKPSAACTYGAVCGPGDGASQGCCDGGLSCRCLEFELDGQTCITSQCANVNITSGQFSILAVEFTEEAPAGAHQTTLEVSSNDPDTPVASVTITGTKE